MAADGVNQDLLKDMRESSLAQTTSVATRLKLIREMFGISQRELAKRAGVTNSSISMIELGQVSPSIQSLERILAVVPIGLSDFFGFIPTSSVRVNKSSSLLSPTVMECAGDQLVSHFVVVLQGETNGLKLLAHDACGLVVEGRALLKSVATQELLDEGDSFYIPAGQLHCFTNQGKAPLRLFIRSLFAHK